MGGSLLVLLGGVAVAVATGRANTTAIPPPARVDGVASFSGLNVDDATTYKSVLVKALADLAGVDAARAAVTNTTASKGKSVDVAFVVSPPPGSAAAVAKTLNAKTHQDVDDATTNAAAETGSAHTVSVFNFVKSTALKARPRPFRLLPEATRAL